MQPHERLIALSHRGQYICQIRHESTPGRRPEARSLTATGSRPLWAYPRLGGCYAPNQPDSQRCEEELGGEIATTQETGSVVVLLEKQRGSEAYVYPNRWRGARATQALHSDG